MKKNAKVILGMLVAVAATSYLTANFIVNERLEDYEGAVLQQHSEQRELLVSIAETTARNGGDAITETIVKDCTTGERLEFENLLSSLDAGLRQSQLIELERLFGRCGSFYAERKSVVIARMDREFQLYKSYTRQLEQLRGRELTDEFQLPEWESLVLLEQQQSSLFSKLVTLQDDIISTLLTEKSVDSLEIKEILTEVRESQENLALANTQASSVRKDLISL